MPKLERKDWEDVKDKATQLIREGMLNVKINKQILQLALNKIKLNEAKV